MRSIRIGNDICLNMTIKGTTTYDESSIKQLRCYLINTDNESIEKCKNHCGYPQYVPSEYTLAACEHGQYHAYPKSNGVFDPFNTGCDNLHDYHWFPGYNGFGVKSKPFCDHHVQLGYLAPSRILEEANRIQCYFPAVEQRYLGTYKLIVVLVIYQAGWGENNLRTYTIDYGQIFKLVDDETGESGDITIEIDDIEKPDTPPVEPDEPVTPSTYKAGYSFASTLEEYLNTEPLVMNEYEWESGKKQLINNPEDGAGAYIWVITPKAIKDLMGQQFQCPHESLGVHEGEYYYKSVKQMTTGEDYIEIIY